MLIVHQPPLGINVPCSLGPANPRRQPPHSSRRLAQKAPPLRAPPPTREIQVPTGGGEGPRGSSKRPGRAAVHQNAGRRVAESFIEIEQDTQATAEPFLLRLL